MATHRDPGPARTLRAPGVLLSALLLLSAGAARAAPLAPRAHALSVLRVLAFDRELARRASGAVLVAVAASPGDAAGEERRELVVQVLRELSKDSRARGLVFEARAVAWDAGIARSLERAAALVVVGRLGERAADVARVTRQRKLLSIGEDPALVEQGLAVAVFARGDRLVIAASLLAARQEGIAFEPSFLRQAELLEFPDPGR